LEDGVAARLATWLATGSDIHVERDGDLLTDRRRWVCDLPDGRASIPCGGTHAESLAALGGIAVSLESEQTDGALIVRMTTRSVVGA
ncbi:MAG: metal-dependent hydrolase, partial [Naasia sp.]